jgi:hypothetical protein
MGGSYAAKRFEVTTWEISFAQSKNAEQSSLANRRKRPESAPGVMQIATCRGFCGSQAYTMVLNAQFRANCSQLVPNFPTGFRIRIIRKPDCRTPDQVAS